MNVIHFLNSIAYLKDKAVEDEIKMKQIMKKK